MPTAAWLKRWEPVQLYVVLILTVIFFTAELVVSHLTHALTLLMDSYHMLCNIFALVGCIITIKHGKSGTDATESPSVASSIGDITATKTTKSVSASQQEKKLKNTFGWARIDVIGMLTCCVFLASLSFSLVVESLQTLFHIDHQHEAHQPILVVGLGACGLLLNGVCYLLIGGYTFHQGSFLYVTESGDVVLNRVVVPSDAVVKGGRRLSRTRTVPPSQHRQHQGLRELLRDVLGCIFVIICGLITYFTENEIAKFVDPILAIASAASLMILSYPYMKESGLILLQTIPDTINVDSLTTQLIEHFPDIVNVHDVHIWQLTASKVISTVHIIFQNPKVYSKIINELKEFFLEYGITQVTIQPEFFSKTMSLESLASVKDIPLCLMKCLDNTCLNSHCCPTEKMQMAVWKSREALVTDSNLELNGSKISLSEMNQIVMNQIEMNEIEMNEIEMNQIETNRNEENIEITQIPSISLETKDTPST